ncbi:MAG: YceI family protein [Acidobacteria bacterium]|nr:YceI family protein [Acidobacteriota bacterium]
MRTRALIFVACTLATVLAGSSAAQQVPSVRSPVRVSWVTVTIQGTSNRGTFLASTRTVRVARVQLAEPRSGDILEHVLRPGGFDAFDVSLPVMTLTSPDEGADDYIHRSLKADTHPEIRFRLRSTTEGVADAMGYVHLNATGLLTVAGVDREVTLNVRARRANQSLLVEGSTDLLMTDFGVQPPKGPLGMLQTDPLIRVRVYLVVTQGK